MTPEENVAIYIWGAVILFLVTIDLALYQMIRLEEEPGKVFLVLFIITVFATLLTILMPFIGSNKKVK